VVGRFLVELKLLYFKFRLLIVFDSSKTYRVKLLLESCRWCLVILDIDFSLVDRGRGSIETINGNLKALTRMGMYESQVNMFFRLIALGFELIDYKLALILANIRRQLVC
jgi:hypothetical protein